MLKGFQGIVSSDLRVQSTYSSMLYKEPPLITNFTYFFQLGHRMGDMRASISLRASANVRTLENLHVQRLAPDRDMATFPRWSISRHIPLCTGFCKGWSDTGFSIHTIFHATSPDGRERFKGELHDENSTSYIHLSIIIFSMTSKRAAADKFSVVLDVVC